MKKFIILAAWCVCVVCVLSWPLQSFASPWVGSTRGTYTLQVPSVKSLKQVKGDQLRLPASTSIGLLLSTETGVLRQSQTVPPNGQPMNFFPSPGTTEFNLFVVDMVLLFGGIVVSMGTSIASSMRADLTGWKVASIVLNGMSIATSAMLIGGMDLSYLHPMFSVMMWVSLGVSALTLVFEIVKLIMYIDKRSSWKERQMRRRQGQQGPGPVSLVPWGGVDQKGGAVGGFALSGHF
ncbi:MAG TPA: hypothetical protein DCE42_21800 [Myxococcales bacterium]|nr:hypothetical protein [Deltaproteobacteria bacterium]MBU48296.1 hypothetical protein [Deltaproteobacteria bacterium]HAA57414.1 hypothetical protein [Myxococcales bacterium]